jgi:hypothetical protein
MQHGARQHGGNTGHDKGDDNRKNGAKVNIHISTTSKAHQGNMADFGGGKEPADRYSQAIWHLRFPEYRIRILYDL